MLSVVGSPYMPTSDAALPNVVKKENLAEANVIFFSSWGVMAGIGAGIGGYLTTVISRNMLFAIDSLSFLLSALIVYSIKKNLSEDSQNNEKNENDFLNFYLCYQYHYIVSSYFHFINETELKKKTSIIKYIIKSLISNPEYLRVISEKIIKKIPRINLNKFFNL